ncbi:hypothetical protein [Mycolicibacterium palauense]|uniref:hypothetical protein n=1 Tax=Mycolicibacterium palauense TaxID=2034511 RepID=UPI001C3F31AB|nr:hypothetical protein [Mycolicibacterium palauense]
MVTPPVPGAPVPGTVSQASGALPPVPGAPVPGAGVLNTASLPGLLSPITGPSSIAASLPPETAVLAPLLGTGTSALLPWPGLDLPGVPGLPIPTPSYVGLPRDLVCEETAWSLQADKPAGKQAGKPAELAASTPADPADPRRADADWDKSPRRR